MNIERTIIFLLAAAILSGCATRWNNSAATVQNSKPPEYGQPSPSGELARSKYGNMPLYEVFGKRYYVMQSSLGYRQRGTASWYGKKFHGRKTSSGETYNMYAFTAAHKSLPLPTNVRVTNLRNGKSIVVRVNDRGPFVGDRIIDMSYAAARQLDMITQGTAPVEIVALNERPGYSATPQPTIAKTNPAPAEVKTATAVEPAQTSQPLIAKQPGKQMYVQVGAFGAEENARRLADLLTDTGIGKVAVTATSESTAVLYRVRIGPLDGVGEYDQIVDEIATLQIKDMRLVFEAGSETAGSATANQAAVALTEPQSLR